MVKRVLLVGLLGIGLMALIGNEASARICVLKNADGTCKLYSGSLECGISAVGIGNVTNDPVFLGCAGVITGNKEWVVGCGNPGSNNLMSPGVNSVYLDGVLEGTVQILPQQVDKNGKAFVNVFARPDQELLDSIYYLNPNICPNPNWIVTDAVPCNVQLTDKQLDVNGCVTSYATFDCSLPNCSTLSVDKKTKRFERREFICTQTGGDTYLSPVCP